MIRFIAGILVGAGVMAVAVSRGWLDKGRIDTAVDEVKKAFPDPETDHPTTVYDETETDHPTPGI